MRPLAYHITYGTYGTRLRWGPRPTVSRGQNEPRTATLQYDEFLWEREKDNLKCAAVILTRPQMLFIEATIPGICERGQWAYLTCAAGPDHVHQVLTSEHDPETIRRLLKRWPRTETESPTWWAEC